MLYPQEVIEEVRSGNDIVDVIGGYVALKPRSGSYFGLCPFHREKTPSFSVNAEKQMFHCFGCGAGGNVVNFVMQIENYDFVEALRFLADRIHYALPQPNDSQAARNRLRLKEHLVEINKAAARFFHECLLAENADAKAARAYLDSRGIRPKTRVKYGLGLHPPGWDGLLKHLQKSGYTPEDIQKAGLVIQNKTGGYYDRFRGRLMFPILDVTGKVIGFGGRVLDGEGAKYLNSPDTPLFDKGRHLYGLHTARKTRAKTLILVEGYMDVISLYQAGFPQTAGVLGTALTSEHARLLKRGNCESVILLLDSDEAGTAAALRAIPILLDGGLHVQVLQVTDAKDPDEYINRYGPERFATLLEQAQSHIAFRVGLMRKKYTLDNTEQRVAFTRDAAALLATLNSAIETDAYVSDVAKQTGIAPDAIRAEIQRARTGQAVPAANVPAFRRFGGRGQDKGLQFARKGLVNLLLAYPQAGRRLVSSGLLVPEEMGDVFFAKMLTIAYNAGRTGKTLPPAGVIDFFETLEEQKQAAEVLRNTPVSYETTLDLEKALNEMVILIKRAWLDERMQQAQADPENGLNAVNTLFEAKRNLSSLYITLTDG